MKHATSPLALALALLAAPSHAINLDDDGRFTLTGFYQLTAGKVLDGKAQGSSEPWTYQQWRCPCAIQNWEYVGVYEKDKGWQTTPESLIGVQLKAKATPDLSATVQLVSRGNNTAYRPYTPTIDWAYLTYKLTPEWTLQAGRKRIPLYYYSDYLYVGYAYPWVRPAPDVYGWPIYAYDGVNALYQNDIGETGWSMSINTWYGNFTQKDDAYDGKIYYGQTTDHSWKRQVGTVFSATNGIIDTRLMYMTFRDNITTYNPDGTSSELSKNVFTRIMGASVNVDYNNIVLRTELNRFEQVPQNFIYNYYLVSGGYKIGNVTPLLTFSQYSTQQYPIEARRSTYLGVRWDFRKDMAFKAQYDISRDQSQYPYPFFGDHKLLSVSLQGVF